MKDTDVNIASVSESLDTVNLMNAGLFGGLAFFYAATIGYYFVEKMFTSGKNPDDAMQIRLKILGV